MQKKLIAVAIAAISAAPAFAQSNVTVYGRVDYGWMSRGGDDGAVNSNGTKDEMASGMQAGSRIGFKGSEDLGNGLKAIFEIEQNVTNDASTTAGLFSSTSRHAYVGLTGNFGTVVGGRLDGVRYGVFNKYDAFAGGGMGNFTQMTGQVDRADNAIAWVSPNWSGFSLVLAHSRDVGGQEVAGTALVNANTTDGRLYTIKGAYENGPFSIDLDYETVKPENSNALAVNGGNGTGDTVVWTIGASYDFGMVKVRALYDHHDVEADGFAKTALVSDLVDYDDWFISATMPYGNFLFKATYGQINDDRNTAEKAAGGVPQGDATKWGLGVNYNLSKRTNVYLDYAQINNDRTANYMLSPAANCWNCASAYGTSGWNLGLAHNF